jgi:hypothetical protein
MTQPTPIPPDDTPLDPALAAAISAELAVQRAPEPLDTALHERVKRRVLQRIAAESTGHHLTLADPAAGWQPFGAGVSLKVLHESGGVMSYLLRLAPGASLPAHRHPIDEECVVLEGELRIGTLRIRAGGFHLGRKDVLHDRLQTDEGALIYLRGAVPEATLAV